MEPFVVGFHGNADSASGSQITADLSKVPKEASPQLRVASFLVIDMSAIVRRYFQFGLSQHSLGETQGNRILLKEGFSEVIACADYPFTYAILM